MLSGLSILVVEDDYMVLVGIQDMLVDLGCDAVTCVPTVEKALSALEAHSFDAAMLDLNLNGEKSYPVADVLANRGIPFMFASGYGVHGLSNAYRDRPLLTKLYDLDELAGMFARILGD